MDPVALLAPFLFLLAFGAIIILPNVLLPLLLVNLAWSLKRGRPAGANPWGEGATTLEWQLPSPPPFHQWEQLPKIK